jgi:metal-responsive CopG/Arc/MetJ family transcriptional regulator
MASQKMTFSLPKDLVAQFVRRVPARHRSRYVADALASRLKDREKLLARACEVANKVRDVRTIERDLDAIPDEIVEPWNETSAR